MDDMGFVSERLPCFWEIFWEMFWCQKWLAFSFMLGGGFKEKIHSRM